MPAPPPLWSHAFLEQDIREQPEYQALERDSAGFDHFVDATRAALASMQGVRNPREDLTIQRVIAPVLTALGWPEPVPKRSLTPRDEIDLVLHADQDAREASLRLPHREQVLSAATFVECKEWGRQFDVVGTGSRPGETAAQQTQRYLLRAGADSRGSLRWAVLTNGGRWRLYSHRADPRERMWEVDLQQLLISADLFDRLPGDEKLHELRVAWLLLRRDSWIPDPGRDESLLDRLLGEGLRADDRIADDLSGAIFRNVYPDLVSAFWRAKLDASADEIADAVQIFLYRLLFLSYAEDRGHLPLDASDYQAVSLRHAVRDRIRQTDRFPEHTTTLWRAIEDLRQLVDNGSANLKVPPYDGGLFRRGRAVLDQIELADNELASIIAPLSHNQETGAYISYRTLSVRQLGSIYERLLERTPHREDDGEITVRTSPYARKDSGSYYTPQELVDLIVEQTLRPLVEERRAAFEADPSEENDPAAAVLQLRVLDPAMGSGHFLIAVIDWLADQILDLVEIADEQVPDYTSPVQRELEAIRRRIDPSSKLNVPEQFEGRVADARAPLTYADQPDDRALVRRMVLKRCIYGVDKNPMAVELAKVALWLHTFTPPLPLPFIDHRIVCGDALLGLSIDTAVNHLSEWMPDSIARGLYGDLANLRDFTALDTERMDESLDLLIGGVHESELFLEKVKPHKERVRRPFNLVAGLRWLSAGMNKRDRAQLHAPFDDAFGGHPGRAVSILYNGESRENQSPAGEEYRNLRDAAYQVADRERILHWEIEFPHVMTGDQPGFDAIISNPPWDRIKLQEVEWWAVRDEAVAKARTAADRKRIVARRRAENDPIVDEFDAAAAQAAQLSTLIRKGGDYPLLGKGDINLYNLFVERSLSLVKPSGIVGLLTPSGIYADHTAADFFRSISTTGRLGGIYDFENRRSNNPKATTAKWFADVHPQFKFCALIAGGAKRHFVNARCGFYLHGQADLEDEDRVFPLAPEDFARINPNTGTAPILRTRRDAEIVGRIYRNHPVLVDHSADEERKLWPVRYHTMFHMTNDSDLFETAEALEAAGAYRVVGNRYKRGDDMWAPLYQGRMIHHFDHRANSIGYNPASEQNPYVSEPVTDKEKANPGYFPRTQYWVPTCEIERQLPQHAGWTVAFRDITNPTNERTMIATIVPWAGFGNTAPLLLPDAELPACDAACLAANFSSVALDFVAKLKFQGTHANWYIVEQLPMIAPDDFDCPFGDTTARELVTDHVLRLCYTAWDLQPFARDLGYEGDPFIWDPGERRQLRARLDALFFHLYGLGEDDTAYILDQFPVLEKNERREHNRYLTKELVLGHYRALAAGDTTSDIAEHP